jgi:hypothetical protein
MTSIIDNVQRYIAFTLAVLTVASFPLVASGMPPKPDDDLDVSLSGEFGFLAPLANRFQYGRQGTEFDYVEEGGQDNVFQVSRLALLVDIEQNHHLALLYQPLDIRTQTLLRRDVTVDGLTFPEGTTLNLRYGFPYYRVGYHYDVFDDPDSQLAFGAALQLRNATINFESADGQRFRSSRDIGPVPLLRARGEFPITGDIWWGFEADGLYAPVKYLNASDSDVVGAILDTSLQLGHTTDYGNDVYLSARYIGGGAEGTGSGSDAFTDGYIENWLHFLTFSAGLRLDL